MKSEILININDNKTEKYNIDLKNYIVTFQYNNFIVNTKIKKRLLFKKCIDTNDSKILKKVIFNNKIYYIYSYKNNIYITSNKKDFIKVYSNLLLCRIYKTNVIIKYLAFCRKKIDNLQIKKFSFIIGNKEFDIPKNLLIVKNKLNKKEKILKLKKIYFNAKIKTNDILTDYDNIFSVNRVLIRVYYDNEYLDFPLKQTKKKKNKKYNYLPITVKRLKDKYLYFRLSGNQHLIFIRRDIEKDEKNIKFKLFESKLFSYTFDLYGKLYRFLKLKKINLFFEKFASKAEEGVFELFEKCRDNSKKSKNYFIISEDSVDFEKVKNSKNVVKKFSLKYYFLLYASSNIIASEAPMHVNILRSTNKTLQKEIFSKKFVFLQHGIIYMKNLGKNSSFSKGKESEPDLMVVSSEKEISAVERTMNLSREKLIKTGLAMFDNITYNHISEKSPNIITIMLTWKPYEEHIKNIKQTEYYKNLVKLINVLKQYVKKENIIILAHPKMYSVNFSDDLKDYFVDKPISEILKITKLIITDYSSVAYNTFYQGGGVIYYQPDIDLYEKNVGKLIPEDDEYIGYRCFTEKEFNNLCKNGIKDGNVDLQFFRNEKFCENYKLINEFCDGKNIERIYQELIKNKYI